MFWLVFLLPVVLIRYADPQGLAVPKPGCRTKCGDVDVPFPFGIDPGCFLEGFNLTCQYNSELGYQLFSGNFEVLEVLLPRSQLRMNNPISWGCYTNTTDNDPNYESTWEFNVTSTRFRVSHIHNKLVAVGCDTYTSNIMVDYKNVEYQLFCVLYCYTRESLINGSCLGIGCCERAIPPGIKQYTVTFYDTFYDTRFSPCSYAVLMEADNFSFSSSYVTSNDYFWESRNGQVPILMDWSISDEACEAAQNNKTNYACVSSNSVCRELSIGLGYSCTCSQGYEGNPYLVDGCQGFNFLFLYFHLTEENMYTSCTIKEGTIYLFKCFSFNTNGLYVCFNSKVFYRWLPVSISP